MSVDEFDPAIERLFARAPGFADSAQFEAGVAAKLNKSSRFRTVALSVAGLAGGVIAVREVLGVNFDFASSSVSASAGSQPAAQGLSMAGVDAAQAVQSLLDRVGVSGLDMGSMGGMQLFWATAGVLVALLAAGVVKLSQEI
ncbi:hypothetical protein [Brevundimonas pondensis]|uniref:Uncharacterized protein n=1 Tax=Brevundimonas pondensis TaxID=2774189 RepID=A0ABX7SMU2_9CAUL|nr:hypothetical protein [Brevundimonas pondensis]QTC89017.1 hypothetical protein IFE19_06715 [Brevundimonas pondensis]